MSCLTKAMLAQGATYSEVQAVLDADRILTSDDPASDHALDRAQTTIDRAAEKYLGIGTSEEDA